MGDRVGDVERALLCAIDGADRASDVLDGFENRDVAASVQAAVDAGRFSLTEALRRLER